MSRSTSPRPVLRGLSLLLGLTVAGSVQAVDLWTVARDALDNDAGLASARSGFSAVEAGRDIQRGTLLPQLSAGARLTHDRVYESQRNGFPREIPDGEIPDGEIPGGGGFGFPEEENFNSLGLSLEASQAVFDTARRAQLGRAEREIDREAMSLAATGQQLLYALDEQVRRYEAEGRVTKYEYWEWLGMVRNDAGRCIGSVAMDLRTNEIRTFPAEAVMLATGGPGIVFGRSTNSVINTGTAAVKRQPSPPSISSAPPIPIRRSRMP